MTSEGNPGCAGGRSMKRLDNARMIGTPRAIATIIPKNDFAMITISNGIPTGGKGPCSMASSITDFAPSGRFSTYGPRCRRPLPLGEQLGRESLAFGDPLDLHRHRVDRLFHSRQAVSHVARHLRQLALPLPLLAEGDHERYTDRQHDDHQHAGYGNHDVFIHPAASPCPLPFTG